MSTVIDEKIVSMQFDNRGFEKNTAVTMNSLRQLENTACSAGFKIQDVWHKMSNFFEFNVAQKIVNSAMNITKALTIEPVSTGLKEYETQLNAVQTILANTESKGTTLDDVNAALDTLNEYADETIYNFTEMTRSIGLFTASGVDLDTSVSAIQGIANLAAVSGSTSQQASTAMYQLSQALADGVVRLQDWNSVRNAGMGGEVFQKALKDTARAHGVAIDEIIESNGSFRESLKDEWLTAEILTETLEQFTYTAKEGSDEWNRLIESLQAKGYTKTQAEEIIKMGNTATDAATKVKTASQLFETLKESAQSGWAQTFEIIIGDFEEAKKLWTSVSEVVGGFIDKTSKARNELLGGALNSGWKKLLDQGIFDKNGFEKQIKNVAKSYGVSLDEMAKDGESFEETLRRAMNDNKVNADMLSEGLDNLTSVYSNYSDEQLKNEGISNEQVETLKKLNHQVQIGEISMDEFAASMKQLSGRELLLQSFANIFKFLGKLIKPLIDAFNEMFVSIQASDLYNVIAKFHKFTEQLTVSEGVADKLKRTFKGLLALFDIARMITVAVTKVVTILAVKLFGASDGLLGVTANLGDLLVRFRDFLKKSNSFEIFFENVLKIVGHVGSAIRKFFSVLMTPFKPDGLEKFKEVLVSIWNAVKNIAGKIGGFFKKIGGFIKQIGIALKDLIVDNWSLENLEKVFDILITGLVGGGITALIFKIRDIFKKYEEVLDFKSFKSFLKGIGNSIKGVFDAIRGPIEEFQNSIKADALKKIATAIAILVASILVLTLIDQDKLIAAMTAIGVLFSVLILSLTFISKMDFTGMNLSKLTSAIVGIGVAMLIMSWALKSVSKLSWDQIKAGLLGIGGTMAILLASLLIIKLIDKINGETLVGKMVGLAGMLLLLTASLKILGTMSLEQVGNALLAMGGAFAILLATILAMKLIDKMRSETLIGKMIGLAGVLAILSLSLKFLGTMSWDEIGRALTAMSGALVSLTVVIALMKLVSNIKGETLVGKMLTLAGSLVLISLPLKLLGTMSWDDIKQALTAMSGALIALTATVLIMKLVSKINGETLVGKVLALSGMLIITSLALKLLGTLSWGQIKRGLTAMGGALLILTGTLALLKLVNKITGQAGPGLLSILAMTGILLVVAADLKILGMMSWEEIGKGLTAMAGAFAILVGAMAIMSKVGGAKSIAGAFSLIVMAAAINVLIPAIALLGNMNTGTIVKALITIASALAMFGVAGALLSSVVPYMIAIAAAIGILGVACMAAGAGIALMSVGLSVLITTLTTITAEGAKSIVMALKAIIEGIASMLPFVLQKIGEAIVAFCEVITQGAPALAKAIVSVLLSVIDILVTIIPELAAGLLKLIVGILDVLAEYSPQITEKLFELILGIITKITDFIPDLIQALVNIFIKVFEGFANAFKSADGDLLLEGYMAIGTMAKMMALLNTIALLIPGAILGVVGLGLIAGEMALVFAALGKLAQIQGLKELVGEGGGLLQAVGTAIGKFVGGIVGGVAEGVTGTLPAVGSNLSSFMTNLKPFLDGLALLDATVLDNAKTLSQVILTITASNILDALTSFLTGGVSVADFGNQIAAFGSSIKKFAEETSGINPETVTAAAKAGEALGNMAKNIPTSGGLWNLIGGTKKVGDFGDQLAKLGPGIAKFDEATKGVNPDTIEAAARAGKTLGEMAKTIPTKGGLWDLIAGKNDLADFGKQLGKFGGGVKAFSEEVKGTDLATIESGVAAGKSVAAMAKTLPTTGGLWNLIKGQDGAMASFASGLITFASAIKSFVNEIGDGSIVASACEHIKQFNQAIVDFSSSSVSTITQSVTNIDVTFVSLVSNMMVNAITIITNYAPIFSDAATLLMLSFATGFLNNALLVATVFKVVVGNAISVVSSKDVYSAIVTSGQNFATGFANGIKSNTYKAVSAATAMATAANNAVRAILKICSPSKVAEENGEYYGGAFVDTVADFADKAYSAGSDMATSAVEGLKSASNIINQVLEEGVDTQPVITPVLNLNEVQSGVVSLNNMLGVKSSIGLTRANSISTTMMKIQNGGNDDVISAIKDLQHSIDNYSGDTYQINGITVDSGQEISAAFETILRAAKIERRR